MSSAVPNAGFGILCDARGVIQRFASDALGISERIAPGMPFTALVDDESQTKADLFFSHLLERKLAFNWEMNVRVGQGIQLLFFGGSMTPQGPIIVGTPLRNQLVQLLEETVRTNAGLQAPEPLTAAQQYRAQAEEAARKELEYYEEIIRLNNELLTVQRDLAKKNRQLEELNAKKDQFLGMAAHDLRTPLGVISTYAGFLMDETGRVLNPEQREFLSIIRSSSDYMLHLVTDLLDTATIASGKLTLERQPTDIVALARRNILPNRLLAEQKQITLNLDCEEGIPPVNVDPGKLEQVLNNLISNAVKYSYPDTAVSIRVARQGNDLEISVQDQGQGIPAGEMDKLFRVFQVTSVKTTAGEKRVGLGLAIVKRIVEGHGGKITVESQVGQGSIFRVSLPLGAAGAETTTPLSAPTASAGAASSPANAPASAPSAPAQPAAPASDGVGIRLLLAEDSILNQRVAVRMLEKNSYAVQVANNGKEVLDILERQSVDAILMDVYMPEMDGLEATREIRRREASSGAHVPIIAMTAALVEADRDACFQAGMDSAVDKPLQIQQLRHVLANLGIFPKE